MNELIDFDDQELLAARIDAGFAPRNCANCRFSILQWKHDGMTEDNYKEEGYFGDELICRRFPPIADVKYYVTPSDVDIWLAQPMPTHIPIWPRVLGCHWCGEWDGGEWDGAE
jgi:hypothetical protein